MYTRRAGARRAVPRGARRVRPQAAGEGEGREEKKKVVSSTSLVTNGGGSCSGRWRAGGAQNKHLLFTDHGPHSLTSTALVLYVYIFPKKYRYPYSM